VKTVVLAAGAGQISTADAFFRTEYLMNLQLSRLPIPFVALIDGIVLGGGAGISVHGTFRVATER
jgi:enoyl-CoA hydratase/carnithine racemase